jgi:hypothetical protein
LEYPTDIILSLNTNGHCGVCYEMSVEQITLGILRTYGCDLECSMGLIYL